MSLVKKLWIAIAVLMFVSFGVSLVVSVLSARNYLEQQLQIKNIDNATSLALSMTQMAKDQVTLELQVAAQFDAGHYRFIRVTDPSGKVLVERRYDGPIQGAPEWFARLIPIHAQPGVALIQDGWSQFGTLSLASHDQYVYQSLWQSTLELLGWFVMGAVAAGALGSLAIRLITRPLKDVVNQAQAIAERRFLTVTEPKTPELRAVSRAMNSMVDRLKAMFAEEAARLEALRNRVNSDAVTGLATREFFMSHLREVVGGEQFGSTGCLVLVRLSHLNELNTRLGHQRADQLLQELGQVLNSSCKDHEGQRAGRVKGGEFAVVCPDLVSPTEAAQTFVQLLQDNWQSHWDTEVPELFHLAVVRYQRNQPVGELLMHADQALARARAKGPNCWHAEEDTRQSIAIPAERWRTLLTEAVTGGRLSLAYFPVVKGTQEGPFLHQEGMIRLRLDATGQLLSAGDFMPMAASLDLTAPIDLGVVKLAIEHLRTTEGNVAVNLSSETISNFGFRHQLVQLLSAYPALCQRLLFEVPEYGVLRGFDAFRDLTHSLKALGCRVGIEFFGQHFAESSQLTGLGLDYIKVHPNFVRGISSNTGNQEFLKGLCTMGHSLGLEVIAQGVESQSDLPLLAQLGFDGATGPGVG